MAKAIYGLRTQIPITTQLRTELTRLYHYLKDKNNLWKIPIGWLIPRTPNSHSYGDASQQGIGFWSADLEIFFYTGFPPRTTKRFHLSTKNPNYLHINEIEFLVIIIQVAATIQFHEEKLTTKAFLNQFPHGLPPLFYQMIESDNMSAESWIKRVASYSTIAKKLLDILALLYQRPSIQFNCKHINGEDNEKADVLSSQNCNLQQTNPTAYLTQIFQKLPCMRNYQSFHPTEELISTLTLSCSNNGRTLKPKIPKTLGQFKATSSIILNGALN